MSASSPEIARACVEAYLYTPDPLRLWIFQRPPSRGSIWAVVSGKIDPSDVDAEAALRREVREETGLTDPARVFSLDWVVPFEAPDGSGAMWELTGFGVEVDPGWTPTLSTEHVAAQRVDPAVAVGLLHYGDNREAVQRLVERVAPPPRPGGVAAPRVFAAIGPELFEAIRHDAPRRLALQVPAGLVRNANDLAQQVREATGVPVHLAGRACFGACDVPTIDEVPGADAALVLGHAPIPNVVLPLPTYFVEMRYSGGDPAALVELLRAGAVPHRLGIVASVQHLDLVPAFVAALERAGFSPQVGQGDRRLAYAAQALGCNYTGAEAVVEKVDAFVFLGTGRFHPIGLALATDRPVYSLDPLQRTLEEPIDRGAIVRRRQLLVASVRDAPRWGILVSTFAGQNRSATAQALQLRARRHGRTAEIISFARIDPRDLEGRAIDAYVNTACPRIAIDDSELYPKPVLTPPEFLMALGELPLEPYRFDTYH
ncbi:MAG: diphthamide biosynthesis enzyme Dph2 [Thermoplasmata archaeon]